MKTLYAYKFDDEDWNYMIMNKNFVRSVVVHIIQFPLHFLHFTTLCTNISIHTATRLGTAIPPSLRRTVLNLGTTPIWYTSNSAHTWWQYSCTETHSITYIEIDTQSCQVTEIYSGNLIMWPYFRGLNKVYMQQLWTPPPPKYGHFTELVNFTGFSVYSFTHSITITICSKKGINSYDLSLTSEYNYIHIYTATQ